ncbi:PLDc N-terminal domain-containing protein [Corynebacterium cystitidis]|uniref:PLDc N-terminal domain-containing protein n=1 Tax=Corynebacterium cystitidis TaxID=35757 RepID=UPI00211F1743|nr:PLDc N-terminal domain-containing protein [Corynebacterium cystitidis]
MSNVAFSGSSVLVPPVYDIAWSGLLLLSVLLPVVVVIGERRTGSPWPATLVWALLALVVPLVGFVVWLVWSAAIRPELRTRRDA